MNAFEVHRTDSIASSHEFSDLLERELTGRCDTDGLGLSKAPVILPGGFVPSVKDLLDVPHGLLVLGGNSSPAQRRACWDVVARTCDSLFLVGPLSEKPLLQGAMPVRLLECSLDERTEGLVQVLRFDPHAVHVIGPADDGLLQRMVRAALAGCVAIVETPETTLEEVLDRIRRSVEPDLLWPALREILMPGEAAAWTVTRAIREAGVKGAPTADLVGGPAS